MEEHPELEANLDFEKFFLGALQHMGLKPPGTDLSIKKTDPIERIETTEKNIEKVADAPAPTPINLFQHPDAHPLVLDLALLRKYGPEWMEWESETLEWRIPQDFRTASVSDLNMSKIMAVKTMHFVDSFWERWEAFLWCLMPLNGMFPDFMVMQVPTAAQCLVAVDTANKIRQDVPWSDEVKNYLAVVFKHDGIFCQVDPIDFITIETNSMIDLPEIQKLWPEVRASGKAPQDETITAEQLRRMLTIKTYLDENRERLRHQLSLVPNV